MRCRPRTGWYPLLVFCLAATAALILLALPLAGQHRAAPIDHWAQAPITTFIFPLVGLFMAPIYPALNSAILSAMPRTKQSADDRWARWVELGQFYVQPADCGF